MTTAARRVRVAWASASVCVATMPFVPGLTGAGVFYVRDLSLFFWGRYVWLRRELWSGHFPLWNPYVGAGQSVAADALHQMFLPPALALRLIGSEVLGFNLWVAMPFPIGALGAWLFFARRFTMPAATLGALAFAVSGPIVATSNFPNMSWSVSAIPWVLWAVDRIATKPAPRRVAVLAVVVALQAAAGEPVTLLATLVTAGAFALLVSGEDWSTHRARIEHAAWLALGVGLGLGLAAIQLVPLASAAAQSERSTSILKKVWSLHPVALLETVSLHLFGDYFTAPTLAATPWLPALNSGREPFFFSIYFGVPLLALAMFGLVAGRPRRWTLFWACAGVVSLVSAFGGHTPVYPFLRDHLPLLASFRFPAKYMVVASMAVAAQAAAGWDAMEARATGSGSVRRGRVAAAGFALAIAFVACVVAAACMYVPHWAAFRLLAFAGWLDVKDSAGAAEVMLRTLPQITSALLLISVATAVAIWVGAADGSIAVAARASLYGCLVIDLLVHAVGLNPVLNPAYLAEPPWLSYTRAHPDARFYVGGKREGTLDAHDLDSSGAYFSAPGLSPSASRAALSGQADFDPSAWRSREMLSGDLAVLWPRSFEIMTARFLAGGRHDRDLLLERTGVRYRVFPRRLAAGHTSIVPVPYLRDSFLFDWGDEVAPRVSVVAEARIVPDVGRQIAALFDDDWDHHTTAIVERETEPAGVVGPPVAPFARVASETANHALVEAGAGATGGHLVMLDSYSDDWRVTVDGRPASVTRANGLFRAVRLNPGHHEVAFVYRPRAFLIGAAVSATTLCMLIAMIAWSPRWRRVSTIS